MRVQLLQGPAPAKVKFLLPPPCWPHPQAARGMVQAGVEGGVGGEVEGREVKGGVEGHGGKEGKGGAEGDLRSSTTMLLRGRVDGAIEGGGGGIEGGSGTTGRGGGEGGVRFDANLLAMQE